MLYFKKKHTDTNLMQSVRPKLRGHRIMLSEKRFLNVLKISGPVPKTKQRVLALLGLRTNEHEIGKRLQLTCNIPFKLAWIDVLPRRS